jgi:hypothetical protein
MVRRQVRQLLPMLRDYAMVLPMLRDYAMVLPMLLMLQRGTQRVP